MLPSFYQRIDELVGEDEPSNSVPSIDHNTDELPFPALGGRRFEVLSYLLEIDGADEIHTVTLVQASGDKGRDILVHRNGKLIRIIQCKNLLRKIGKPDVLQELVKLLLFDETESFLPAESVAYELWAPRGFTETADTLIAEWPNKLDDADILSAFQKVTSTYKTLEDFRWETIGAKLVEKLKSRFRLSRQDGITLSRRVRSNLSVYQQFFQAVIVMRQVDVELYMEQKLGPKLAQVVQLVTHADLSTPGSQIDKEIEEAVAYINSNRFQPAESLLKRLDEQHGQEFNHRQRYRVKANLGAAVFRLGRSNEAAEFFLAAAALEPEDERASINEVLAHFLLGHDGEAFELANERRKRYPSSGRLLAIWINTSPANTSIDVFERAISEELRNDPEVNSAMARRLLLASHIEAARDHVLRAQQMAPEWPQGFLFGAHCAIAFHQVPPGIHRDSRLDRSFLLNEGILAATKARELAETQSDTDMQSQALAARSELYMFAGNFDAASADAKQACRLSPSNAGNLLVLAQTQLTQNKIETAVVTLEQALEIQDRADVRMMLGRALRIRNGPGDRERSVDLVTKQHVSELPELMRPPIAISVVQVLGSEGEWARASNYLQSIRDSLDVVTWQALSAYILKGDGHPQDAEGRVSEALANLMPSTHLYSREFLARVLMNMGKLSEALPLYEELFSYDIPAFDAMQLIECAGRLKRDDVVLDTFDELHRRTAVDWPSLEIEVHYLQKYHAAKAIDRLSAFVDKYPDHKVARLARSVIAWSVGKMDLVASRLEELPSVNETPISYIRMALKVMSFGEDAGEAIDYAYRYLKLHFNRAEAHSALIFSALFLPKDQNKDPNLPSVIEGAAVCYRELPNGPLKWTVLEKTSNPDSNFEERSVDDPIAQALLGKSVGDKFVLVPGMVDRVGEITQILPKYVRRFQDSLTEMAVRFPSESANFQSLPIEGSGLDSGVAAFLSSIRKRAELVKEVQALYSSQPIPVHLYAQRFGKNAYTAMMHLAQSDDVPVKCANFDSATFAAAIAALEGAKSIVLDLSAIATIRLLGLEDLLTTNNFVLSQDSALELRQTLMDNLVEKDGGTMVYQEGRYTMYEETAELRAERIQRDKEFCEGILGKVTSKPHLALASIDATQRDTLINFLGQYGTETVVLAMEPDTVLWTDDLTQGDLSTSMFGVQRIWSQVFLEHCYSEGAITAERYAQAVARLIGLRYQNTTFNNAVVLEAAKLSGFQPHATPFAQVCEAFSLSNAAIDQLLRLLILFFLQLSQESIVPQGKALMLVALLDSMWQNPLARKPLLSLRKNTARVFGLNVVAEAEFKVIFDGWIVKHSEDVL